MKIIESLLLFLASLSCAGAIHAQATGSGNRSSNSDEACGPLRGGHYGPFDYRPDHQKNATYDPMPHADKRVLVEGAHFTPRVESLLGSQSGGQKAPPGRDLSYTLRSFPNNHRALVAVMRYGEKFKTENPPELQYPVECYFERAIRFAYDDSIVRIIYATYLTKKNRTTEAIAQLKSATKLAEGSAFTHYNIGLAYFEMKEYGLALESAHRALALGFEKPDLPEKLRAAGQWQDPVAPPANDEIARESAAASDAASSPKSP